MLRKCSRLLAAFMAAALVITTFGSDFSNARAWAAEDEVAEEIQNEGSGDGIVTADWEKVPESDGDGAQGSEEVAAAETSENVQGEDEQNDGSSSENTDEPGTETFAENGETTNPQSGWQQATDPLQPAGYQREGNRGSHRSIAKRLDYHRSQNQAP